MATETKTRPYTIPAKHIEFFDNGSPDIKSASFRCGDKDYDLEVYDDDNDWDNDVTLQIDAEEIHESIAGEYGARKCILDGNRGIYLPQNFAEGFDGWKGIKGEDQLILLAGPEHEHYHEAWDDVVANAEFTDEHGDVWHLEQDGDLFAVRSDVYFD